MNRKYKLKVQDRVESTLRFAILKKIFTLQNFFTEQKLYYYFVKHYFIIYVGFNSHEKYEEGIKEPYWTAN